MFAHVCVRVISPPVACNTTCLYNMFVHVCVRVISPPVACSTTCLYNMFAHVCVRVISPPVACNTTCLYNMFVQVCVRVISPPLACNTTCLYNNFCTCLCTCNKPFPLDDSLSALFYQPTNHGRPSSFVDLIHDTATTTTTYQMYTGVMLLSQPSTNSAYYLCTYVQRIGYMEELM